MSLKYEIRCDECSAIKGETNHWFLIDPLVSFKLRQWSDGDATVPGVRHICGSECAIKALSKWIQRHASA